MKKVDEQLEKYWGENMEKPYSKRELDEKFKDIKESLDRIEEQTKKTNGTVASLQKWRYTVVGFCLCITIVLIPILIAFIKSGKI